MPSGDEFLLLLVGLFVVSILYSSVGHGGASGYVAVMTLVGVAPKFASTTGLYLNLVVAGLGWIQFAHAGHFRWGRVGWFALGSVPAAVAGGLLRISMPILHGIFAVTLAAAGFLMVLPRPHSGDPETDRQVAPPIPIAIGAALGFVSGIVGVGGGIFLSPLMALTRWSTMRRIAATSAAFIVINSIAGLVGRVKDGTGDLTYLMPLAAVVLVGGAIGSWMGARKMSPPWLRATLGVVVLIAAYKMATQAFKA